MVELEHIGTDRETVRELYLLDLTCPNWCPCGLRSFNLGAPVSRHKVTLGKSDPRWVASAGCDHEVPEV